MWPIKGAEDSTMTHPTRPFSPLDTGQNITACTGINGVPLGGLGAG